MSTTLAQAVNGNGQPKTPPELASKIQLVKAMQGELDMALPPAVKKVLTPDRICRLAITAMRQVRNLDQCTFPSLAGALMVAAQLGLEPCTPLGHCYLIPRKNGRTGQYEATFQIGYQGMLELAYRTETVKSVTAKTVHAADVFIYEEGLNDQLIHRPCLDGDRGPAIAYYAIIKFVNGGHAFDVMSHSDMVRHMERFAPTEYQSKRVTGPWATDFDEMARKTMIRRLFKMMRKSTDIIAKATIYDERVIERDQVTSEIRPIYDEPQNGQLPKPAPVEPQEQAPEIEEEAQQEPEPQQEQEKPAPVKATKAPSVKKKAPAKPAESQAPAQTKASDLGKTVAEIEEWFNVAVAQNEEAGMPELADFDGLADWLWPVLVESAGVNPDSKHWYTRANELAKLPGGISVILRTLDSALEKIRADYMGEEEGQQDPQAPAAEEKAPAKSAETPAEKMQALEKWFDSAAAEFEKHGHRSLVMPSAAVAAVYKLAFGAGLLKSDGTANGYRTRLIEICDIPGSSHDVIQKMKPFCKQLLAELNAPEPGSDG